MFLIDTSVWIDYLRKSETLPVSWLRHILDVGLPFGITPQIFQELLQGTDSQQSFDRLAGYFCTQVFYYPEDPMAHAVESAQIYFRCRRRGITIRSSIDCSIAQTALEHDLILLHADRDFDQIQEVVRDLRIYRGGLDTKLPPELIQEPVTPYDKDHGE